MDVGQESFTEALGQHKNSPNKKELLKNVTNNISFFLSTLWNHCFVWKLLCLYYFCSKFIKNQD